MIAYGGLPTYVKGNVALIGDAAAQTNYLTKGGIRPARVGGKMLAKYIVKGKMQAFDTAWKKSSFNASKYKRAFVRMKQMDNKELCRFARPLLGKPVSKFFWLLANMKYWRIYRRYLQSEKYGFIKTISNPWLGKHAVVDNGNLEYHSFIFDSTARAIQLRIIVLVLHNNTSES
ncbi:hypothetical protein GF325_04050 [Candidatus Bathyarchaeota archaeon]|nr:hypothetical protein [Candidatus Bathyarchaeota archaeon]